MRVRIAAMPVRRLVVCAALAGMCVACGLLATRPECTANLDIADACAIACDNLRSSALNCPEGHGGAIGGEPCTLTCVRLSEHRPLPLGCWSHAKDAAEARGCGSLRCIH